MGVFNVSSITVPLIVTCARLFSEIQSNMNMNNFFMKSISGHCNNGRIKKGVKKLLH